MTSPSRFVRRERRGDLELVVVDHPHAHAAIAVQGAQLLQYRWPGAEDVVWLSEAADFREGEPVRGGIPVCAPWFGALERNPPAVRQRFREGGPAHGLVRSAPWQLEEVRACGDDGSEGVRVSFALSARSAVFDGWSGPVAFRVEYVVGPELRVRLTATALEDRVDLTLALHTYLAVSDVTKVLVGGLEGVRFLDTLEGWSERREEGPVRFGSEVDRVYLGVDRPTIVEDPGWQRRVSLRHHGSRSLVLWNPHVAKTARLSQMHADGWRRMLCIETANVLDDAVRLEPGASHELGFDLARG